MLASSVLVIFGLVAGAQGALMPRQSNPGTAAPGCLRCPTTLGLQGVAEIQTDGNQLCIYYDGAGHDRLHCVFDGTTGARAAGSDAGCTSLSLGPATPAAFQCPATADLSTFELNSSGDTVCSYTTGALCQYNLTGEFDGSLPSSCAQTAPSCGTGDTTRRSYRGENNFTAVKRRQAARARAALTPRRLALSSMKQA